jgi:hypothetical protein
MIQFAAALGDDVSQLIDNNSSLTRRIRAAERQK